MSLNIRKREYIVITKAGKTRVIKLWSKGLLNSTVIDIYTNSDITVYKHDTNSRKQSPSWQPDNRTDSQEIPRFSWNSKVHYRLPLVPIPGYTNTALLVTGLLRAKVV
jgi:hypothetical protein